MLLRRCFVAAVALVALSLPLPARAESTGQPITTGRDLVLAGLYSDQWHAAADLNGLGATAGRRVSLAGTFHHLRESEDGWEGNTDWILEQVWMAQATPLANVNVPASAAAVAAGALDADIRQWALRVKGWLDRGGGRSLLVAPMQEMNGDWVPYGMDPQGYRAAYRRFVQIFRDLGIDETEVRWVFAPNSWSTWPYRIADYYPGDDVVDFLGISAYNLGSQVDVWTPVAEAVVGLSELQAIAPYKPYILTQVGSSTAGGDRDAWLRDLFHLSASHPNIVGFAYFNFMKETDWKLWDGTNLALGWREGMQMPSTAYRWPLTEWFQPGPIPFAPYVGRFADDDALTYQPAIEWLVDQQITQGCMPKHFCPAQPVTREQLASFLVRALHLPASAVDRFPDDEGSPHEADINALAASGITVGCSPEAFCPTQLVSRQQLASLLARALELSPSSSSARFVDPAIPVHQPAVNALVEAGITQGCAPDRFCPYDAVRREEVAVFLQRALGSEAPEAAPRGGDGPRGSRREAGERPPEPVPASRWGKYRPI